MSRVLGTELDFPARVYLWSNGDDASGVERVESSRFEQLIFTGGTRVLADLVHVFSPQPWIVVHELTHVVTKQAGEGIAELPAWLDEGVATYSEGDWRARRGLALQRALEDRPHPQRPLDRFQHQYPRRPVDLFYGQAADIVEALLDEFGDERFADLFAVFKRGSTVDAALMEVYGFDREGLDAFYRTQRGLEARGETADRSTRIEDEQIGPAGAESQAARGRARARGGAGARDRGGGDAGGAGARRRRGRGPKTPPRKPARSRPAAAGRRWRPGTAACDWAPASAPARRSPGPRC